MPDPKNYIDDDYTFVKGHVRRKSAKPKRSLSPVILFTLLLILIAVIVAHIPRAITYTVVFLIPIGITLYLLFQHRKRKLQMQQGDYYTITHKCPNCGKMNDFKYPRGSKAHGTTVECWNCHRDYTN